MLCYCQQCFTVFWTIETIGGKQTRVQGQICLFLFYPMRILLYSTALVLYPVPTEQAVSRTNKQTLVRWSLFAHFKRWWCGGTRYYVRLCIACVFDPTAFQDWSVTTNEAWWSPSYSTYLSRPATGVRKEKFLWQYDVLLWETGAWIFWAEHVNQLRHTEDCVPTNVRSPCS